MKLGDRIKQARRHAGFARQEDLISRIKELFGAAAAPKQQTISRLEAGKAETSEFVVKIAIACGVNPAWLDSGKGSMVSGESTALTFAREPAGKYHSEEDQKKLARMVEIWDWIPSPTKTYVLENLEQIAQIEREAIPDEIESRTKRSEMPTDKRRPS